MAPPQRPLTTDVNDGQLEGRGLPNMGVNLEEEERSLSRMNWPSSASPNEPYPSRNVSFDGHGATLGYQAPNGGPPVTNGTPFPEVDPEVKQERQEQRADWEASRHSQNPLWDSFLYGGTLNDRIRKISLHEHLTDPQHGVLVNTQKTGPPPHAQVNGQEGATRIINKGQAILDIHKGERLGEVMKLLALATKTRLTGLMSASNSLAIERRAHSQGKIPAEWEDLAVRPSSVNRGPDSSEAISGAVNANPLKRKSFLLNGPSIDLTSPGSHDEANSEATSQRAGSVDAPNVVLSIMDKVLQEEKAAEAARRAKRAKRKAAADAASQAAQTAAEEAAVAQASEPKKVTKKQKNDGDKIHTQQAHQHQQANEAAKLAMSSMLGGRKGKQYSWMTKGPGSGTTTPRGLGPSSSVGTPKPAEPVKPVVKEKKFGAWDEDKDAGVQVRDVLLVLESDGRATRAYAKSCAMLDS
jgi:hypothetical protein